MTIDHLSSTWRHIEKLATEEIDTLHLRLEAAGLSERESDVIRGQIIAYRRILDEKAPRVVPRPSGQRNTYGF